MAKNPISLLQELAVQYHFPLPIYEITAEGAGFKATVSACGVSESATGDNKKTAKCTSARRALDVLIEKLNIPNLFQTSSLPSVQTESPSIQIPLPSSEEAHQVAVFNAIGKLNEYCSQKQVPYPTYREEMGCGQFVSYCSLFDLTTTGCGLNKKSAKQIAAKEMLARLKDYNPMPEIVAEVTKIELTSNEFISVVKKYDELALVRNTFKPPSIEEVKVKSTNTEGNLVGDSIE